ncbi:MAG: IS4 family transposase [Thiobacillaceae bacterium]
MSETSKTLGAPDEWAMAQWGRVDLGDARLNRRAVQVGAALAAHPDESLPRQIGSAAALQGAYDLLNHPHVTLSKIAAPHWENTRRAAEQRDVVLFIQDTTELNYTHHPHKEGLGPVGDGKGRGLLLHTTLAVTPGPVPEVLGVAHQQTVLRQPSATPRPKYTESPEGRVWAEAAGAVGDAPGEALWVHVGDGGSDDFRFMHRCWGKHFLLRVARNRLLAWDEEVEPKMRKLRDYARTLPCQHRFTLKVSAAPKRPARVAQMCLAWGEVTIPAPAQGPLAWRDWPPLRAWVLRSWEEETPPGVEALEWILLTSVPTTTVAEALERTQWYAARWLVEDYHQCLKTGCRIEQSRLDHREDIDRLLGFCGPVAVRLLQLRQAAREDPEAPAEQRVEPFVVQVLARRLKWPATTPITAHRFWYGVAQLGGYLGRKRDSPPGWQSIWHGWRYLQDLVTGARLYATDPPRR